MSREDVRPFCDRRNPNEELKREDANPNDRACFGASGADA